MEITKANEPIYQKANGTYVMTRLGTGDLNYWCGFPDDPDGCHAEVEAYLAEHPEALIPEPVPPEPTEEELAARRKAELLGRLAELDRKSIRPIRSLWADINVVEEQKVLDGYEAEAARLREELKALG